jgi:hypothetical protein
MEAGEIKSRLKIPKHFLEGLSQDLIFGFKCVKYISKSNKFIRFLVFVKIHFLGEGGKEKNAAKKEPTGDDIQGRL